MKIGISHKINVSKIDKARLFKGEKGIYLNFTGFVDTDEQDQYGNNGMLTQDVSKEEKDNGVKGAILGNSRVFWKSEQEQQSYQQPENNQQEQKQPVPDDDIPF